ncbi:potassium channel subfamily K member 18 [Sphaerodactylus townsendi]|uniref:potassium channel subfamily K member 18 n=1 Tax=Sphaerodactylus townsendi TaxID=933632 RepID=UPI0020272C60|nr:potassium channel subfamily K member 18 [Sphaerodactylus townsendi]
MKMLMCEGILHVPENETSYEMFEKNARELIREIQLEWFIDPKKKWTFLGSLFFCCTVFTTVGYGHTYPRTRLGKYLCMLYALFGIPLMFLVLTDMGDVLAATLSTSYNKVRQLLSKIVTKWFPASLCKKKKGSKPAAVSLRQSKIVICEPLNVTQMLRNQSSLRSKPGQYRNAEIFEKLIAREIHFLAPPKPIERRNSCPQLDTGQMMDEVIENIDNIGKEVEKLDVPFPLMTLIVFAYISCVAAVLPHWESHLDFQEAFYFCFITLTTIGFGDIALQHPNVFLFFSLYIVIGIEIVIIAFKLGQDRLLGLYKKMIFGFRRKTVAYRIA